MSAKPGDCMACTLHDSLTKHFCLSTHTALHTRQTLTSPITSSEPYPFRQIVRVRPSIFRQSQQQGKNASRTRTLSSLPVSGFFTQSWRQHINHFLLEVSNYPRRQSLSAWVACSPVSVCLFVRNITKNEWSQSVQTWNMEWSYAMS